MANASAAPEARSSAPSTGSPGSATKLSAIRANRSRLTAPVVTPQPPAPSPAHRPGRSPQLPSLLAQPYGSPSPPPAPERAGSRLPPAADGGSCGLAGQHPPGGG